VPWPSPKHDSGIINKELGLNFCENLWQGSFIVDELTDRVEEAVYQEFERISERGGVLGAMDNTPSSWLANAARSRKKACTTTTKNTTAACHW
jgi:methylmalonyl-CoA mutase